MAPPHDLDQMERDLRELLATIQNPHLRQLLGAVFGEARWASYRDAPAGQALPPRLPPRPARALARPSPKRSARSRPCSAGSTATSRSPARCCTTSASSTPTSSRPARSRCPTRAACRARSRSATTAYAARSSALDGFPPELAQALLHIILSHHGALEHGSPVVPCTREATLVHMIDNLGGRLGSFDRLERELRAGEQWSAYDKALGGGAYFASPDAEREREAACSGAWASARRHRSHRERQDGSPDAPSGSHTFARGATTCRKLRSDRDRGATRPTQLQLEGAWRRTPKS